MDRQKRSLDACRLCFQSLDHERQVFTNQRYHTYRKIGPSLYQVVSYQNLFGINRNHGHKSASRICKGAVTPFFGPLDRISCLGPLGGASGGWRPRLYNYQLSLSLGFGFCLVLDFLVKQTLFCCNCAAKAACCEPGPRFLILFACGD